MSWGTCYKASNNIHAGFPALMAEGNLYTDWHSACQMNNDLKQAVGITDNYSYRQWLINNGTNVINKNKVDACSDCCGCMETFKPRASSNKYLFKSCADKIQPFGYEKSDLKNLYLTSTALQNRLCAPIMSQAEMLQQGKPNYN